MSSDHPSDCESLRPSPRGEKTRFWSYGGVHLALLIGLAAYLIVDKPSPRDPAAVEAAEVAILPPPTERIDPATTGSVAARPEPSRGWIKPPVPKPRFSPLRSSASREFVTYKNRDSVGGDYDIVRDLGQGACALRCESDRRCRAYTFNRWENLCFLKASVNALRIEPRGITGVVASEKVVIDRRQPMIRPLPSRTLVGESYRQLRVPDYHACAETCLHDSVCFGFNFSRPSHSCALMAAIEKPVASKFVEAGIKVHRPRNPPQRIVVPPDMPPEVSWLLDGVFHQLIISY